MESLIITLSHRVITLLSFRHPSSFFDFEICRFVEQKKSLNQLRKLQCAPAHCSFLRWAFQPLLAACCSLSKPLHWRSGRHSYQNALRLSQLKKLKTRSDLSSLRSFARSFASSFSLCSRHSSSFVRSLECLFTKV